jgi:hypothetical protein
MKFFLLAVLSALVIIPAISGISQAGNTPKRNIALSIMKDCEKLSSTEMISKGLEMELSKRGYSGKIRLISDDKFQIMPDEGLVKVKILNSSWSCVKAFSIPYLLNRYKNVFTLRLFVEIVSGDKTNSDEIIARNGANTQAQVFTNDKYDADLFLDQSDRINIESKTYSGAIKDLAEKIGSKLK